jgi:hypothetical protein
VIANYARATLLAFGSCGGSKKRRCTVRATRCTDRAGLPVGLELSRDRRKERGPLLVIDRRSQREQ